MAQKRFRLGLLILAAVLGGLTGCVSSLVIRPLNPDEVIGYGTSSSFGGRLFLVSSNDNGWTGNPAVTQQECVALASYLAAARGFGGFAVLDDGTETVHLGGTFVYGSYIPSTGHVTSMTIAVCNEEELPSLFENVSNVRFYKATSERAGQGKSLMDNRNWTPIP
jgi:hypothetical protein